MHISASDSGSAKWRHRAKPSYLLLQVPASSEAEVYIVYTLAD